MNFSQQKQRFHWLTDDKKCTPRPEWDKVLFETEEFAAIPSLGSLVPGWMLIVPKRRVINLRELSLSERERLRCFTQLIFTKMSVYGLQVYQFEHGGLAKSPISCGVEQAHMHLVPLPFDLIGTALESTDVKWKKQSSHKDLWEQIPPNTEYLMMADKNRFYEGVVSNPTSQWFRKLIAEHTGQSGKWDYNLYPNLENIDATLINMAA